MSERRSSLKEMETSALLQQLKIGPGIVRKKVLSERDGNSQEPHGA
jgi:hypothetical protein